nr:MAG TPA: hypothetical protein [Caudoviricetes sp.]
MAIVIKIKNIIVSLQVLFIYYLISPCGQMQ